jgi:uncharacterized protein (UPF0276 family)
MRIEPSSLVAGPDFDLRDIRGVGLRPAHYPHWHAQPDGLPWLEIMADNYLFQRGGPGLSHLDRLAKRARCLVHGVGLSIASRGELDADYLRELRTLCGRVDAHVVSDHLCFTHASGRQSYDLLPIPYTESMLRHVADRVSRVQDALGRRFALENVSSYVSFRESELTEMEFLRELCNRTGCGILLDVNNVYVSAVNHGQDAHVELAKVDPTHVLQYHVAGHSRREGFLHDTHDQPVDPAVWELCALALARIGPRPFVLENDDDDARADDVVAEIDAGLERIKQLIASPLPGGIPDAFGIPIAPAHLASRSLTSHAASFARQSNASPPFESPAPAWQDEFLDCVQSPAPVSHMFAANPALALLVESSTRHRVDVYRVGYFSRVTATLAGTLFEKASILVSEDYMRGVLGRYFELHPATAARLTESCEELPDFAETLADVCDEVPWLPDFLRLCLARWKVLTSENPTPPRTTPPDPSTARLQRDAVMVESSHPLFELWRIAETNDGGGHFDPHTHDAVRESSIRNAVLIFKSAPTDLEMIVVDPQLTGLLVDLLRGLSVEQAIDALDTRSDDVDSEVFGRFLTAVGQRNGWV